MTRLRHAAQQKLTRRLSSTLLPQLLAIISLRGHLIAVLDRPFRGIGGFAEDLPETPRDELVNFLAAADPETQSQVIDALISESASTEIWASVLDGARFNEDLRAIAVELITQPDAMRLLAQPISQLVESWPGGIPGELRGRMQAAVQQLDPGRARTLIERSLAEINLSQMDPSIGGAPDGFSISDDLYLDQLAVTREELKKSPNAEIWQRTQAADKQYQALFPLRTDPNRIESSQQAEALALVASLRSALLESGGNPSLVTEGWCALARLASTMILLDDKTLSSVLFEAADRHDALPGLEAIRIPIS